MKTLLLKSHRSDVNKAGELLKNGGLVGIPTETVYGLAADAGNGAAVAEIFRAKGRPMDNPLIVHISRMTQLEGLISVFPEKARQLAEAFWPGPLTIILPKKAGVPDEVTAGLNTVAVRFPAHPVARAIIEAAGCPLAAPSANSSGKPSPTTAMHVMDDLNGKIAAVVDGGDCGVGVESTVITLATNPPRLLRPGGLSLEELEGVLGHVDVDKAVVAPIAEGEQARAPGMKYRHYAPKAPVTVVTGAPDRSAQEIRRRMSPASGVICFEESVVFLFSN